jgi:hypothetical protein
MAHVYARSRQNCNIPQDHRAPHVQNNPLRPITGEALHLSGRREYNKLAEFREIVWGKSNIPINCKIVEYDWPEASVEECLLLGREPIVCDHQIWKCRTLIA